MILVKVPIKLPLLAAITLLLSIVFQSCSITPGIDDDTTVYTRVKTDLYKLTEDVASRGNVRATVYMMGSIHIGKHPYEFSDTIEEKFSESDIVVVETLAFETSPLTILNSLSTAARNNQISANQVDEDTKTYNTLKGYVDAYIDAASDTPNFYDTYVDAFVMEADGIFNPKLSTTEPIYAQFIFSSADVQGQENGVDFYFYERATAEKKVLEQLETPKDGINAFFNIDIDEQTLALIETIKTLNGMMPNEIDIESLYATGNINGYKAAFPITEDHDSTYEELLSKRNSAWVTSLKEIIKNRDEGKDVLFIIVGWAHTISHENTARTFHIDSFQKLLDNDGFSLEIVAQDSLEIVAQE